MLTYLFRKILLHKNYLNVIIHLFIISMDNLRKLHQIQNRHVYLPLNVIFISDAIVVNNRTSFNYINDNKQFIKLDNIVNKTFFPFNKAIFI